jgi:hypothetical protein
VLECDDHTHSLRWPGPPMSLDQLEVRPPTLCMPLTWRPSWRTQLGRAFRECHIPAVYMEEGRPQEWRPQGGADFLRPPGPSFQSSSWLWDGSDLRL